MDATSREELKKGYKRAVIVGAAMIGSLLVYAFLVETIKTLFAPFRGFASFPQIDLLRYFLFAATLLEFFVLKYFNNLDLSGARYLQSPSPLVGRFSAHVQKLVALSIVNYAVCNSVAIYGLLLFLIAGGSTDFYGFLVVSLVLHAIFFPRLGRWEERVGEAQRRQRMGEHGRGQENKG